MRRYSASRGRQYSILHADLDSTEPKWEMHLGRGRVSVVFLSSPNELPYLCLLVRQLWWQFLKLMQRRRHCSVINALPFFTTLQSIWLSHIGHLHNKIAPHLYVLSWRLGYLTCPELKEEGRRRGKKPSSLRIHSSTESLPSRFLPTHCLQLLASYLHSSNCVRFDKSWGVISAAAVLRL